MAKKKVSGSSLTMPFFNLSSLKPVETLTEIFFLNDDLFALFRLSHPVLVHRHLVTIFTLIGQWCFSDVPKKTAHWHLCDVPKSLYTDDSSSQAKEVMFFQNISLYVVNITFTCYCYHNIFTCCQACQKNSGTKAWRGENPCKICNDRRDEGPSTLWSRQHCCCWKVWKVWVSKMLYGAWCGKVYIHSIQLQIW